ncbi:MAG TPA: EI24 domain-containing protein, partial [Vicinamibacteria bacterium]
MLRPGLALRAAAGAWHAPAGLGFLLRNRSLWPLALAPLAVAATLLNLGMVAGAFLAPQIEARLAPSPAHLPALLGLALTLSLWFGVVVATTALGLTLSMLVTAPLLDRLSRKVEAQLGGRGAGPAPAERRDVLLSLRTGLAFVAAASLALGLAMVPLVGPFLSAALSAPLLAYQAIDPCLHRRDL